MDLDLDSLMCPVSADSPAGENQEYNSKYLSLEELAIGVPANEMGESVVEGKDPEWSQLRRECLSLWQTTRDLRVASYFCVAELVIDGLEGFSAGIKLIKYLFEEQWEIFWPQLDPDDDNDPLERLNIISMISPAPGAFDDPLHFLALFRNLRLAPNALSYTLRDLMIANGELDVEDYTVDINLLKAEMTGVAISDIIAQKNLVDDILDDLNKISDLFNGYSPDYAISFVSVQDELKRLKRFYSSYSELSDVDDEVEGEAIAGENGGESSGVSTSRVQSFTDITQVKAKNRSEAMMLLRKGCEYFQTAEPTSPVPFLISRALRMAEMNFMDLLAEVDSNALERGRDIFGVKPPQDEEY